MSPKRWVTTLAARVAAESAGWGRCPGRGVVVELMPVADPDAVRVLAEDAATVTAAA